MSARSTWRCLAAALAAAFGVVAPLAAHADEAEMLSWSQGAARGLFQLCNADAPDAGAVAEHGEVWGWPPFMGYLEHPDGYKREAGGESRLTHADGDLSAYVEATVQSGKVVSLAPVNIAYFRCNMASDQKVDADLKQYFTELYGPPAGDSDAGPVWLVGAAKGAALTDDDAALKAVAAAGAGAEGTRIELSHEAGEDRANLTFFRYLPAA